MIPHDPRVAPQATEIPEWLEVAIVAFTIGFFLALGVVGGLLMVVPV